MNAHANNSATSLTAFSAEERNSINQSAANRLLPILKWLLPGGAVRGQEYVVRNPRRADNKAGSFKISHCGPESWRLVRLRD